MGYLPLDDLGATIFFQLVSARYERGSIILTSNKSYGEWGSIFGDPIIATAILDRLLHHSTTINIRGESYRLKERRKAGLIPLPDQQPRTTATQRWRMANGNRYEFFKAWAIYRPMGFSSSGQGRSGVPLRPCLSRHDESQPPIPQRVGLHRSPPPLQRPVSSSRQPAGTVNLHPRKVEEFSTGEMRNFQPALTRRSEPNRAF